MKTRLTHVRANVSDLEKAIEWYERILGFKVIGRWPKSSPVYAHFEMDGGAVFSIFVSERHPSNARFNFSVTEVERLWELLRDKVDVIEPLYETSYHVRKFTIRDPDGNELGFVEEQKPQQ